MPRQNLEEQLDEIVSVPIVCGDLENHVATDRDAPGRAEWHLALLRAMPAVRR